MRWIQQRVLSAESGRSTEIARGSFKPDMDADPTIINLRAAEDVNGSGRKSCRGCVGRDGNPTWNLRAPLVGNSSALRLAVLCFGTTSNQAISQTTPPDMDGSNSEHDYSMQCSRVCHGADRYKKRTHSDSKTSSCVFIRLWNHVRS